jgi:hypothetical protein
VKPYLIPDSYGHNYWYTPVGTYVHIIVYEDIEVHGLVTKCEYDPKWGYCIEVTDNKGDTYTPWDKYCVRPLSKLEKAML